MVNNLEVFDSQANFVLCKLNKNDSTDIAIKLLSEDIFIKDLKTKSSFNNEDYVRLAIRSHEDNAKLVKVLKEAIE